MPIYEFECLKCSRRFEYLVRQIRGEVACPGCGGNDLRKLISSFAFKSRDSHGNITDSSSGCSGCTSNNCASCAK